jgi:hypothetical protein
MSENAQKVARRLVRLANWPWPLGNENAADPSQNKIRNTRLRAWLRHVEGVTISNYPLHRGHLVQVLAENFLGPKI